jgi:hypothetical protein
MADVERIYLFGAVGTTCNVIARDLLLPLTHSNAQCESMGYVYKTCEDVEYDETKHTIKAR